MNIKLAQLIYETIQDYTARDASGRRGMDYEPARIKLQAYHACMLAYGGYTDQARELWRAASEVLKSDTPANVDEFFQLFTEIETSYEKQRRAMAKG